MTRILTWCATATAILASVATLSAQATDTTGQTTTPPPVLTETAAGAYERRDAFPSVNIYLPEGQATIRLRKLIRNALFESQIDYDFINGDISTYLRYKYYARNYTYRIGVFDSIEFPNVGESSDTEFERVRGGLVLIGLPKDYNNRYYFLLQNDRLTFGDFIPRDDDDDDDDPNAPPPTPEPPRIPNFDNRQNNIYLKIGYQLGTPFDERMNAIVGETRGRLTPVLTAFRDIGPQRTGLAAALTQSGEIATGDYRYTKFEAEGLRRFDITAASFVFSRLHVGAFLGYQELERDLDNDGIPEPTEEVPEVVRYSIPRYELFRLGGREALKSISSDDEAIGTREFHLTNELFVPIFRNRDYRLGAVHWNTVYGIGYVGAGTVGFDFDDFTNSEEFVVDAGLGTEQALTIRDFNVFLSVVVARTMRGPEDLGGTKVRFSIRTVR